MAKQTDQKTDADAPTKNSDAAAPGASDEAKTRLATAGRNDPCPCGSGKKYKKCHLRDDEARPRRRPPAPDPQERLAAAWRLFEQRRPGAAEKRVPRGPGH